MGVGAGGADRQLSKIVYPNHEHLLPRERQGRLPINDRTVIYGSTTTVRLYSEETVVYGEANVANEPRAFAISGATAPFAG